jgi:hypothetical protein
MLMWVIINKVLAWNLEVFSLPFVSHTGYDMQLVEQGSCIC